mmetsp:Transcript_65487/g.188397  ORF Transcript_65487/g.188397 Transcript_65487/m.188397 type:complete len:157 (+) Transcript_65487:66-536(+)
MLGYVKNLISLGTGCVAGATAATAYRCYERNEQLHAGSYVQKAGDYYQVLGHAWDFSRRDFCVVFRPLRHVDAKTDSHEAHVLATSDILQFGSSYEKVSYADLDTAAKASALPGPFWKDPEWALPAETSPVAPGDGTSSGLGSRSHQERPTKRSLS